MKKFIQIFFLLSLAVVFSASSANAQTVQRFEADIPFTFEVGNKSYEAGTYVLRMSNTAASRIVTIEDREKRRINNFFVLERGDVPRKNSILRFVRNANDTLVLAKIITPEKGFAVGGVNLKSKNKHGSKSSPDTVSINLK